MRRKRFVAAKGVSNIELFYDLIFVYCISMLTSTMHHVTGGFFTLSQWGEFTFSYLVVLQIWFFTVFLMNRYGDNSAHDNVCLFINMFLLYYIAQGIQAGWRESVVTFNVAWALVLLNLIAHWGLKLVYYDNLDSDDKRIMSGTIRVLAIELAAVVVAAFLPASESAVVSWIALSFGALVFAHARSYRRKPARFAHLVERCTLITIIAFGETVVALGSYVDESMPIEYPLLVFALVVGLFLIYVYERDNMTDHHSASDGMTYLTLTGWIILVIGNVTVALEYMPMVEVAFLPKSLYLMAGLVLYLFTSFLLGYYNKPEYKYSRAYIIGRLGACAAIVAVALFTNFDPKVNLVFDVVIVYSALLHEFLLYRRRSALA